MHPTQAHTDPTPADVLRRAADHLERYGFNQGSLYDNPISEHPAACADGALLIAAYGKPTEAITTQDPDYSEYIAARLWLSDYLYAQLGTYQWQPIGIHSWNDSPDTTGVDVIDTLRAAAAAWDTEHAGGDPA